MNETKGKDVGLYPKILRHESTEGLALLLLSGSNKTSGMTRLCKLTTAPLIIPSDKIRKGAQLILGQRRSGEA